MSDEEKAVYDTEHRRKAHAEDASETENASDEPGVHYHDDKPVTFWTRFDRFNQELERKIGIESVSGRRRMPSGRSNFVARYRACPGLRQDRQASVW